MIQNGSEELKGILKCILFIPLLKGNKTPTSKVSESKEIRWGDQLSLKARLVRSNNQWGMKKPH
ncbi:hypothetical protein COL53_19400 [Bacillus pseudomycoides]|uniref:Uncharacterized protein n=1 Tax=Bacillus pseudomycoides TaxID=64104 RepID=A0ABD6T0A7_9BACI|nr:hypothetical protein COO02_23650 [Bacillus pseudomycoides]PEI91394.1 hypothetical protein CN679_14245 [Bacillus pseudomycoides]PEJ22166.1 hypothetical protein CN887_23205 [Bacillus pseudomycoides]PFY89964.1 hypothetical protein COL53_19400 [Bacillus pseudomycoides]PGA91104.1 hypothetical protein COL91_11775 [Bacillus pseudomycoides]